MSQPPDYRDESHAHKRHTLPSHTGRPQGGLIIFEGIDGAGKSTVAHTVTSMLISQGIPALITREPSDGIYGTLVRKLLNSSSASASSSESFSALQRTPQSEYFLFAADRADHVARVVKPALQEGKVVLCDRMGDSSIAYQGYGRGLDITHITSCNAWIMGDITPLCTVYLAISYEIAHHRMKQRPTSSNNSYDYAHKDFFERVIQGYERLYTGRTDVIWCDASAPLPEVVNHVYAHILRFISCR